MKRVLCLIAGAMLAASTVAAQPPAGGQPTTVARALQQQYAQAKQTLTAGTSELMEADYSFKPTPEIRPYGALFTHVADAHYFICSLAKGVPNPMQGVSLEMTKTSRA